MRRAASRPRGAPLAYAAPVADSAPLAPLEPFGIDGLHQPRRGPRIAGTNALSYGVACLELEAADWASSSRDGCRP